MAASCFTWFHANSLLFSTDMKNWEILTHIDATSQPAVQTVTEPVAGSPRGFFNLKPH